MWVFDRSSASRACSTSLACLFGFCNSGPAGWQTGLIAVTLVTASLFIGSGVVVSPEGIGLDPELRALHTVRLVSIT